MLNGARQDSVNDKHTRVSVPSRGMQSYRSSARFLIQTQTEIGSPGSQSHCVVQYKPWLYLCATDPSPFLTFCGGLGMTNYSEFFCTS